MNKKMRFTIILFCILGTLPLWAGGKPEPGTPQNVRIDNAILYAGKYYTSNTGITLRWDSCSDAEFYLVDDGWFYDGMSIYALIEKEGQYTANSTSFTKSYDTGAHQMRVRGANSKKDGAWSNWLSFQIDTSPPQLTTVSMRGENKYFNNNLDWYKGNVEFILTATDNEGGSGIHPHKYQFREKHEQTWQDASAIIPRYFGITATFELCFRVFDVAGNVSTEKSQIISIDWSPPEKVTNVDPLITETIENGLKKKVIKLSWEAPPFDNPNGGCGVAGYDIAWKREGLAGDWEIYKKNSELIKDLTFEFPVTGFQPGESYRFAVRATDHLSNSSTVWTESATLRLPPEVAIDNLQYEASPVLNTLGEPVYGFTLHLNKGLELLAQVNAIKVYCAEEELTQITQWQSDGGRLFTKGSLAGKKYAHKSYLFRVALVPKGGGTEQLSEAWPAPPVPNYKPKFRVELKNISATTIVDESPQIFQTSQPVEIRVVLNNGALVDPEGDRIQYKLWDNNVLNGIEIARGWVGANNINLLTPNVSCSYHCYVEVIEYTDNIGGNERSLFNIYEDYTSAKTLYGETKEGFMVDFDLDKPAGIFKITSRTGDKTYSQAQPVNTEEINIVVIAQELNDATGPVMSGLKELRLANINTSAIKDLAHLNPLEIATIGKESFNYVYTLDTEAGQNALESDLKFDDWNLLTVNAENPEGLRLVAMKVIDKAGNEHYYWKFVHLDKTSPQQPDANTINLHYFGTDIKVSWNALPDDISNYEVWYAAATDVDKKMQAQPQSAETLVKTEGYQANHKIDLLLYAVDKASNRSAPAYYTLYTLAKLGTLSEVVQAYSEEPGHSLTWQRLGGEANRHELIQVDANGGEILKLKEENGLFSHKHLRPHGEYHYQLLAYNESGYCVASDILTYTLKNTAPTAATALMPAQFAQAQLKLTWNRATDVDGDPLAYHVYWKSEEVIPYTLLASIKSNECMYPAGDAQLSLENGKNYSFYIVTDDTPPDNIFEGIKVNSSPQSFIVDAIPPQIHVLDLFKDNQATKQCELKIEVTEELSGVEKLEYWTDDATGTSSPPKAVDLTPQGAGKYGCTITLNPGSFKVWLRCKDRAGNEGLITTGILLVDVNPPVVEDLRINLEKNETNYLCASTYVPVQLTLRDELSGIKALRYGYSLTPGGEVNDWNVLELEAVAREGSRSYERTLKCVGVDGQSYFLTVEAVDGAGNLSEKLRSPIGILLDKSNPAIELRLEGLKILNAEYFTAGLENVNLHLNIFDEHSGIESTRFALVEWGNENQVPEWQNSWEVAREKALVNAHSYRLLVKAINGVGLAEVKSSEKFSYDATPPLNLQIEGLTENSVTPGEWIALWATAKEPDSDIIEYRLAIGNEGDSLALTKLLFNHESGFLIKQLDSERVEFRFTIPAIADGEYKLTLQVKNAAGLVGYAVAVKSLIVKNDGEKILVEDQGPYTSSKSELSGRWKYSGSLTLKAYEYRVVNDLQAMTEWKITEKEEETLSGMELVDGRKYYFEVRALYPDGTTGPTHKSLGIIVDSTEPVIVKENFIVPQAATSRGLWVSWYAYDNESKLEKVQVLIEKAGGGELIDVSGGYLNLTCRDKSENVTLLVDKNGQNLTFATNDKLYLTIRFINYAGLIAEQKSSLITIDGTPPTTPVVIDQGPAMNLKQYPEAQWLWSEGDKESGIASYSLTIVRSLNELDTATWYVDKGEHKAKVEGTIEGFTPMHGETWYFVVEAKNNAGLTSRGISNGITYDASAPYIAAIKVMSASNLELVQDASLMLYAESMSGLKLGIDAYEDVTDIVDYSARYGMFDENQEWQGQSAEYLSKLPLIDISNPLPLIEEGKPLVFKATCFNEAGLAAYGYSSGLKIDSGLPKVINVNGVTLKNLLLFNWEVEASNSPVIGYVVELKALSSNQVVFRKELGKETSLMIDAKAEKLEAGYYQLHLKAKNSLGKLSTDWAHSSIICLDITPPTLGQLELPAYVGNIFNLYLEAHDKESGVSEYQYQMGTFEEAGIFTDGWISVRTNALVLNENIQLEELTGGMEKVKDGSSFFLSVRVKNGAGLWSENAVSKKLILDRSTVKLFELTAPLFTTKNTTIANVSFKAEDTESGISTYALAAVEDTDLIGTAKWQEVKVDHFTTSLDVQQISLAGLNLEHAKSYYIIVRAKNGTGTWSNILLSEAVQADFKAPELNFNVAAEEYVVNEIPSAIKYELIEDVSKEVEIQFELLKPDGTNTIFEMIKEDYKPGFVSAFNFEENEYGLYELKVSLKDSAGNKNLVNQSLKIRVNQAPQISLNGVFETRPGNALTLMANYVKDPDGDEPLSYLWDFGDGSEKSIARAPVHIFEHQVPTNQKTSYTIGLIVKDSQGKESKAQAEVLVRNTEYGDLYRDEYWSGVHYIKNNITIPVGRRLIILPQTEIIIIGNPVDGYLHRLTVLGSIEIHSGVKIHMRDGETEKWDGIWISGQAKIEGASISNANCALAFMKEAHVILEDTELRENTIGIQVLNKALISRCKFIANELYGIKEDGEGEPAVRECIFNGNGYDYYDSELTIIEAEKLIELSPENIGNSK